MTSERLLNPEQLVPRRRRRPVPEHVVDGGRPLVLEALRELVGFLLGGITTAPHLLLPGLDHRVAGDEASEVSRLAERQIMRAPVTTTYWSFMVVRQSQARFQLRLELGSLWTR